MGVGGALGASFSMMSAFGNTSVDWYTNQSRPHSSIHWLPEELRAACGTSPLELSDLLTEALKTAKKKEKNPLWQVIPANASEQKDLNFRKINVDAILKRNKKMSFHVVNGKLSSYNKRL